MENNNIKDEYKILHNMITKKVKEENEIMYNAMIYYVAMKEANKGYKIAKHPKLLKEGTEITYTKMKSKERTKYMEKLKEQYLKPFIDTAA